LHDAEFDQCRFSAQLSITDAALAAFEKSHAEFAFQALDLGRQQRLREMCRRSAAREKPPSSTMATK